ncbi:MAG: hypothetical protein QNK37_13690 [Acidobacteriota bacterium]|nr:hypothetical protein [Acidobacteriota bacterium]
MLYNPLFPEQSSLPPLDSFSLRVKNLRKRYETERPPPHLLIQGPSGSGKTKLLAALAKEVTHAPSLGQNYLPLLIGEEHYPVFSLCTLWEYLAETLARRDPAHAALASEMRHRVELSNNPADCLELLRYRLESHGQVLLLFLEHLDRLVRKFSIPEREAFLDILTNENAICMVAGTNCLLDPAPKHLAPLLPQFETLPLRGLDIEDTRTLLLETARAHGRDLAPLFKARPGLPEVWQRLTGGLPRLIVHLGALIDPDADDTYADLVRLMDRVTPDYQARLDRLPAQQQAMTHVIARDWDLINAGVIASRLRLPSKLVSAQLGQLFTAGAVSKRRANKKNHLYFLRDRFMNLWFLKRHGTRHDCERLRGLVRFMEVWYAPKKAEAPDEDMTREVELTRAAKAGKNHGWLRLAAYYEARDRIDEAEVAYKRGIEQGDAHAMNGFAKLAYVHGGSKKIALALAKKAAESLEDPKVRYNLMMIRLWNGQVMESVTLLRDLLDEGFAERYPREVLDYLLRLGARDQLQLLDRLFWENPDDLRDRFKPFYSALMHLLQDRYPKESKRAGPELEDMIQGILDAVEALKKA